MAGVTTCVPRHGREPFPLCDVTHVVRERPCTVERSGPEIIRPPRYDVARAVADTTADAFDTFVGQLSFPTLRGHPCEVVLARPLSPELPLGPRPLVEKRRHVGDEVFHDRQIV